MNLLYSHFILILGNQTSCTVSLNEKWLAYTCKKEVSFIHNRIIKIKYCMFCFLTYHSFFNIELQFTSIFGIFYHCPAPWVIVIYLKCNIIFTVFSLLTSTLGLLKYLMKCAWQLNYGSIIKFNNICIHEYGRNTLSIFPTLRLKQKLQQSYINSNKMMVIF